MNIDFIECGGLMFQGLGVSHTNLEWPSALVKPLLHNAGNWFENLQAL